VIARHVEQPDRSSFAAIRLYSAACSARCWKVSSLVMTRKDGCRTEKRELDGDGIADEKGEVTP
jgi:hypothetical protein